MHIHSYLFGAIGLAGITGEVDDPCKTRKKTPVQRVRCSSALSSGLTPPPPMKNARRAAGHKTTQRRRRRPPFVGAQLYYRLAVPTREVPTPDFLTWRRPWHYPICQQRLNKWHRCVLSHFLITSAGLSCCCVFLKFCQLISMYQLSVILISTLGCSGVEKGRETYSVYAFQFELVGCHVTLTNIHGSGFRLTASASFLSVRPYRVAQKVSHYQMIKKSY